MKAAEALMAAARKVCRAMQRMKKRNREMKIAVRCSEQKIIESPSSKIIETNPNPNKPKPG